MVKKIKGEPSSAHKLSNNLMLLKWKLGFDIMQKIEKIKMLLKFMKMLTVRSFLKKKAFCAFLGNRFPALLQGSPLSCLPIY